MYEVIEVRGGYVIHLNGLYVGHDRLWVRDRNNASPFRTQQAAEQAAREYGHGIA